ncbi:MAG: cobalamin B12-binding domain-containing protein, partial [Gaiellales bacterium]
FSVSSVSLNVLLPALREIGARQQAGELGIGHEHFASNLIRGRLWGLTRSWDQGGGSRAVLACAPKDHHDLGLLVFGIALRERGWRITYLGVDTPAAVLASIVAELDARAAVVSFTRTIRTAPDVEVYRQLSERGELAIGGRAASAEVAAQVGAVLLDADPVSSSMHEIFNRP